MRSSFRLTHLCVINAGIPPLISQRLPLRSLYERIRSVLLDLPTALTRLRNRRGVLPEFRALSDSATDPRRIGAALGYPAEGRSYGMQVSCSFQTPPFIVYAKGGSPVATLLRSLSDIGVRRRSVWHLRQAQDVFRLGCLKSLFLIQRCLLRGLLREF